MDTIYLYRIINNDNSEILLTEAMSTPLELRGKNAPPEHIKNYLKKIYPDAKEVDCLEVCKDAAKHLLTELLYSNIVNSIKKHGDSEELHHLLTGVNEMRYIGTDHNKAINDLVEELQENAGNPWEIDPNIFSTIKRYEKATMSA